MAPHEQSANGAAPGRLAKANILLVDDNPANLLALEAVLGDLGHPLVKATSGELALRLLAVEDFAVVLLDVRMQGLDGFETAKRIRGQERSRHTPIIFITAYDDGRFSVEAAYALGAVDYLLKPLVPVILRAKVAGLVELFEKTERLRLLDRRHFEQALADENARLRESEGQLAAELEAMSCLHALSTHLFTATDLRTGLEHVLEGAIRTSRADFGNIQLFNPQAAALETFVQRGFGQDFLDHFRMVRMDEGSCCAQAMQSGERMIIEDVELDPSYEPHRPIAAVTGYRAVQSTPLKSRSGSVLGMLSTHFRRPHRPSERDQQLLDLYARHAADFIERLRADEQLRAVREQLQLVTDVMAAPVSRCSRDLRYLWVSKILADWLGRPPEEIIDRPIRDIIGEEAFEQLRPHFEQVLSGHQVSYEEEVDYRGLGRRWVNAKYTPTVDANGAVDGWVAVVFDITARKRAEAALQDANRRKDEFLAMLSHELRNPLAPIRNAAHVLDLMGPADPKVRKATEMIQRQVQHLTRLVDDLLDVSRITRGKIRLRKEPVELTTVVAQAVETSRPLIEARQQELMVQLPDESVRVEADVTRLAQVLSNLLTNAAKYTPEGGHIRLTAEAEPGVAVIRVQDDGEGIAPELLPRVFDLFTQGDRSLARSEGGLGIGLTLVKSLVELHGGNVEAHSDGPGKGSEFVVRLPA